MLRKDNQKFSFTPFQANKPHRGETFANTEIIAIQAKTSTKLYSYTLGWYCVQEICFEVFLFGIRELAVILPYQEKYKAVK